MPDLPRSLPERPSLRFLKLEAKRRLATGEFPTLHDAQAAIAREHGQPHWPALRRLVEDQAPEGPALAQLRWVASRFRGADSPHWDIPTERELREHFADEVMALLPPGELVAAASALAPRLAHDLAVVEQSPMSVTARLADLRLDVTVEESRPHRMTRLRALPAEWAVPDPRLERTPPAGTSGDVPLLAAEAADGHFAELGLVGLVLAGTDSPGGDGWVLTRGWSDLERDEALDPTHRWSLPGITSLVTATAVLRLVGDGLVALDGPANTHLRTLALADTSVSVRELLSQTSGVADPPPRLLYGTAVPDLRDLLGDVVRSTGRRGTFAPSNGGFAVLGQLVADVTGQPYADAAARLVLEPLGLASASFPASSEEVAAGVVTGYEPAPDDTLTPVTDLICAVPAIGGLWASPGDVVRLARGWSSLLPDALARDALTPQGPPLGTEGSGVGLGWLLSHHGYAVHAGAGGGVTVSLLVHRRDGRVLVSMTNRVTPLTSVEAPLLRAWQS